MFCNQEYSPVCDEHDENNENIFEECWHKYVKIRVGNDTAVQVDSHNGKYVGTGEDDGQNPDGDHEGDGHVVRHFHFVVQRVDHCNVPATLEQENSY